MTRSMTIYAAISMAAMIFLTQQAMAMSVPMASIGVVR